MTLLLLLQNTIKKASDDPCLWYMELEHIKLKMEDAGAQKKMDAETVAFITSQIVAEYKVIMSALCDKFCRAFSELNNLKTQQTGRWTPVVTGDRTNACKGLERQGNNWKMGNLGLQEGELPKSLCIVFSQKDGVPWSGKPTDAE